MAIRKKSKETKRAIIEAARSLFMEKGFKNTGLREICAKAKVNHSLIYYYYKNGKYGIAQHFINEHLRKCINVLTKKEHVQCDYLTYVILLTRFQHRELMQNPIEMASYIDAWETDIINRSMVIEFYTIAYNYLEKVSFETVKIATIMSDHVWHGLQLAKARGDIVISDREIRDRTDLTRWINIGFDKKTVQQKINEAEKLLTEIPIYHISLFEASIND